MTSSAPQFHLFTQARYCEPSRYEWHFVLRATDGSLELDVTDREAGAAAERLELLAVVRGLEALDQPSRVTLFTRSRNVSRGLRSGLAQWREDGWQWESFGQMIPIKHEDLWRRIDQALNFHRVGCRTWRVDPSQAAVPKPAYARRTRVLPQVVLAKRETVDLSVRNPWQSLRQRIAGALVGLGQVIAPEPAPTAAG